MPAAHSSDGPTNSLPLKPQIIDIRSDEHHTTLAEMILESLTTLRPSDGLRSIPTLVLYNNRGLQLFDQITREVGEYYSETNILQNHIQEIITYIPDESAVIELGAGSLTKTAIILRALDAAKKRVSYYALDLDKEELVCALDSLGNFNHVQTFGLLGTYEEGVAYVGKHLPSTEPKTVIWLGSSIGNLSRSAAGEFLRSVQDACMNPGDLLLVGADRRNNPQRITLAYNDPAGITEEFIMNGLDHVNEIFGGGGHGENTLIDRRDFAYDAHYNEDAGRHEAYYKSLKDQVIRLSAGEKTAEIHLKAGERIHVEYSYKYSPREISQVINDARLIRFGAIADPNSEYDLHLCQKPPFFFSPTTSVVPELEEWEELWKAWDLVTQTMIKREDMLEQPIGLRHPFIFYRGHIPGFLDTQLSRYLREPLSGSPEFADIFDRGVDPDVEDPSVCHDHSRVPSRWPSASDVDAFWIKVQERVREILHKTEWKADKRLARVLWMCFEHQAMHLETILHMIVQFERAQPPCNVHRPIWGTGKQPAAKATFVAIPAGTVKVGHDDPEESDLDQSAAFAAELGWDNERPSRTITVPAFEIQSRPVTNGEYADFLLAHKNSLNLVPLAWTVAEDSSFCVRTTFGPVPLATAADWPVSVSAAQAEEYAAWNGARLPTEAEYATLRANYYSPPSSDNYGFRSWHPVPVTLGPAVENLGIVSDGWEITGTPWEKYDGFKASELYRGYSEDHFGEKHAVLLGASWATHPRIAERRSFRNWYQRKYGFMFSNFRLARSIPAQ
ncbi:MAG: C-type lectin protein [Olpidium bornovanus]|uniref:C-type lectin protein n=1 Tax=Olpidium bornovanus TaxID=278681 RepID=A0A8H7ZZX0_9FUNG|nr:MAG: C-type lectin protein [Olpidium bornovanus]